jgi:hypothetical protein
MKKDKQNQLIVLGIILAVFFIATSNFLGALVTTCTTNEPSSITMLESAMLVDLNGSFDTLSDYEVIIDGVSYNFERYSSDNSLGALMFVFPDDNVTSCDGLLAEIKLHDNASTYTYLSNRKVLSSDNYYWCNYDNNIMISTDSVLALSNFIEYFNTCVTEDIPDELLANSTVDDSSDVVEDNSDSSNDGADKDSDNQIETESNKYNDRYKTNIILAIALVVLLYYIFERGPEKGIFKKI